VMEYSPFKTISYEVVGTLSRSAKCAGILLRCYIFKRTVWCISIIKENKMKKLLSLALCLLSFNSFALGGYESLTEQQQNVLKSIVKQLGITDKDNSIKFNIYNASTFAFDGDWSSYWTGLKELSSSKYQDGKEKGVIEIAFNNVEQGTIFLTYVYKPETKQIILFHKQIRHTGKKFLLEEFKKRKSDKETYEVRHEGSNYAMLQTKGKVDYELFHVKGDTGSLVYKGQLTIDL
jgi:hypothetical protein